MGCFYSGTVPWRIFLSHVKGYMAGFSLESFLMFCLPLQKKGVSAAPLEASPASQGTAPAQDASPVPQGTVPAQDASPVSQGTVPAARDASPASQEAPAAQGGQMTVWQQRADQRASAQHWAAEAVSTNLHLSLEHCR